MAAPNIMDSTYITVSSRLCSWFRDEALNIPLSGLHHKIPLQSLAAGSCHAMIVMMVCHHQGSTFSGFEQEFLIVATGTYL
jgi:hypothetical protein